MSVLMEVAILVGEDRRWEFRRIGAGVAQERKQQEVGVVTWLEVGKIEGNYATMLHILQSKKGVRGGKVQGMQSMGGKSGLDPYNIKMLLLLSISLFAKIQLLLPQFFCEGTMQPLSVFLSL